MTLEAIRSQPPPSMGGPPQPKSTPPRGARGADAMDVGADGAGASGGAGLDEDTYEVRQCRLTLLNPR